MFVCSSSRVHTSCQLARRTRTPQKGAEKKRAAGVRQVDRGVITSGCWARGKGGERPRLGLPRRCICRGVHRQGDVRRATMYQHTLSRGAGQVRKLRIRSALCTSACAPMRREEELAEFLSLGCVSHQGRVCMEPIKFLTKTCRMFNPDLFKHYTRLQLP